MVSFGPRLTNQATNRPLLVFQSAGVCADVFEMLFQEPKTSFTFLDRKEKARPEFGVADKKVDTA